MQVWAKLCSSATGGSAWLLGLLVCLGIAESLASSKDLMLAQHLLSEILFGILGQRTSKHMSVCV